MFKTQTDHRVCPICEENSFKIFDYDDPTAPFIPIHPRCRCTYDLIFETDLREAAFKRVAIMAQIVPDLEAPIQAVKIINNHFY